MESITAKALPQLNENATPSSVEDDWIVNFFEKSRIVSDNEMQELWSAPFWLVKRTIPEPIRSGPSISFRISIRSEAALFVPHPVPWTHICAMPPGVAHTPRAPRSACDTQASRDARSGCTAPRSRPRRRGRPRGSERFGRGSACSLSVRFHRSATPFVSGSSTKPKLGWIPQYRICLRKWSDRY